MNLSRKPHKALSVDPSYTPAYMALLQLGAFAARVEEALDHLADCDLCPRCCRVDRRASVQVALCHTGAQAMVHSYGPHHGEEDPLRVTRGSGTIFFAWCNLRCVCCQNWTSAPIEERLLLQVLERRAKKSATARCYRRRTPKPAPRGPIPVHMLGREPRNAPTRRKLEQVRRPFASNIISSQRNATSLGMTGERPPVTWLQTNDRIW
jgi:uncharacterized Fe-S radical SAM superfamily protein PflX